ncbi:MAG: hypothetical protein ABEJ96_11990, partial [Thiohalorhabdaceae bacterium]
MALAEDASGEVARLQRRLERERAARQESERLAEQATRSLYDHQTNLELINAVALAANEAATLADTMGRVLADLVHRTPWSRARGYRLDDQQAPWLLAEIPTPQSGSDTATAPPHPAVREAVDTGRIRWFLPQQGQADPHAATQEWTVCAVPLIVGG